MTALTQDLAEKFAAIVLSHVRREFPNKLDHVMNDASDVKSPRALHPVFHGSFDWHSCVHGYWLLARLLRRFPALQSGQAIRELFDEQITADKVRGEVEYLAQPNRGTFERPYGWAWALSLAAELAQLDGDAGSGWQAAFQPLADAFTDRFLGFLPRATYPIRAGTHFNTAFACSLAIEYARVVGNPAVLEGVVARVGDWYGRDANAQAWEPGGDDFLSPTLMEAECMRRALPRDEFVVWFDRFLPDVASMQPAALFEPAVVSDRSDGKIAHLDGLNFSRAWCWRSLASSLESEDPRRALMLEAAARHIEASLPHVAGDYMGEHWLATFATLALEAG